MRDLKGNDIFFCFHMLGRIDYSKFSDKAAVPGVNRNHLHQELVVAPPAELQMRFSELVSPMLRLTKKNEEQSNTLRAIRDSLLPRLLSGELSVREAEKAVEVGK